MNANELQSIKNRYGIIGNTPQLNHALSTAVQVANTDLTVLIQGESGVGKEVFSQIIHNQSARKHNPFIAINCGAIPEGTIDSELFGHEKGAFTSAVDARKGYFETVNGGTIFLDEIGEMPIGTQARLLRVLEAGEFIRVGSSKVQKTNVRVVAATNKDLLTFVQQGKFRQDLYYRLNTVPIRVPSLRDRKEDIHQLFRKFCVDFAEKYRQAPIQLTPNAVQVLENYAFPGNIRECKNIAEQISALSHNKQIDPDELKYFLPENKNMLPILVGNQHSEHNNNEFNSERDILYKLFFDMKKDVTELKKVLFELAQNPNTASTINYNEVGFGNENILQHNSESRNNTPIYPNHNNNNFAQNNYLINAEGKPIDNIIPAIEESLNIADKERELIIKALKKHRNKRRDAASELGISERTLYRKIKEYDLED